MSEWHELGRGITTIGVVWAIVYGIVRIVNGPVAGVLLRIFDLREDQQLSDGASEALGASIARMESRLSLLERVSEGSRMAVAARDFAAVRPGEEPEHGGRLGEGPYVSDPPGKRTY